MSNRTRTKRKPTRVDGASTTSCGPFVTLKGIPVPKELKGSTVPRTFLEDLVRSVGGPDDLRGLRKDELYRSAIQIISPNEKHEKHLSRGGTVRRSGYLALEELFSTGDELNLKA